ncbi:pyridoxamine 5'-phosphate oxidase family protein [Pseudonocardia sp. NPDC049154]|uniref:pyridoxamine 5'-phosphate oxidase family protein n=1 Tax=Pseudonocardia sp. NPDC049154 TaxID=3155501 RepID=UPI0033EA18AA
MTYRARDHLPGQEATVINPQPKLVALGRTECLTRLAGEGVGRVVVTRQSLPAAHPVHNVLDGEESVFRTPRGGTLAAAVLGTVVAFQVDDIDLGPAPGGASTGVGEAYEIAEPGRLHRLQQTLSPWWATCDTAHAISIPLRILHGRLTFT